MIRSDKTTVHYISGVSDNRGLADRVVWGRRVEVPRALSISPADVSLSPAYNTMIILLHIVRSHSRFNERFIFIRFGGMGCGLIN